VRTFAFRGSGFGFRVQLAGSAAILYTGGLDVIRKDAWPFYRTISGVRLCWELEEPEGPEGCAHLHSRIPNSNFRRASGFGFRVQFVSSPARSRAVRTLAFRGSGVGFRVHFVIGRQILGYVEKGIQNSRGARPVY